MTIDVPSGDWTFIDRETDEVHEDVGESAIGTWIEMHQKQGWPYETIAPDGSREVYDGE